MIVYRLALYRADGTLERVSQAFPPDDRPDPQLVADRCARAADAGCTYPAGTYAVWADSEYQPPKLIGQGARPDGVRAFGPR